MTLSIIEKYKEKLKPKDESDLPRELLCLWKEIDVYDKDKIRIPGLAELNKLFNIVITGQYASFVCGLCDWYLDLEIVAIAPEGTDVEKLVKDQGFYCAHHSLSEEVDDKPYLEIPRFDTENNSLHKVSIFGDELKSEAVSKCEIKTTDHTVSTATLWVWEIKCAEEVERLYHNPLAYANYCVQQSAFEMTKCVGILDKTESKYVFFHLGEKCPNLFEIDKEEPFPLVYGSKYTLPDFDEESRKKLQEGRHAYSPLYKNIDNYLEKVKNDKRVIYRIALDRTIHLFDTATASHSQKEPLSRGNWQVLNERLLNKEKSDIKLKRLLRYKEKIQPRKGTTEHHYIYGN